MSTSTQSSGVAPFTTPKRPLTWFITGCSSGFGLEIVRQAQQNGHAVIATSRNPSRTPDLVAEVESKGGKWLKLNVDDLSSSSIIEDLEKEGQAIDVLVNNAGFGLYGAAEHFSEGDARRQFDTLFFGPYRLTRAAVPYMRKRRFGIVVNISSASAIWPVPTMGIYGAAKVALDSLLRVLGMEMRQFNVRVLTVNPGVFETSMKGSLHFQENPVDPDYDGSVVDYILQRMHSGDTLPGADVAKGVKAMYEVILGEGVGKGHEEEKFLPLGKETSRFVGHQVDQLKHTMEVFGKVCDDVYIT